jgi:hypothetical protein
MQEMSMQEVDAVSGAITDAQAAGYALVAVALVAAGPAVGAAFLAGFAMSVGLGLLNSGL